MKTKRKLTRTTTAAATTAATTTTTTTTHESTTRIKKNMSMAVAAYRSTKKKTRSRFKKNIPKKTNLASVKQSLRIRNALI